MKYDIFTDAEIIEIQKAQETIRNFYEKAQNAFYDEYDNQLESERLCEIFDTADRARESTSDLACEIFLGEADAEKIHEMIERTVRRQVTVFFNEIATKYKN